MSSSNVHSHDGHDAAPVDHHLDWVKEYIEALGPKNNGPPKVKGPHCCASEYCATTP